MSKIEINTGEKMHLIRRCGKGLARVGTVNGFVDRREAILLAQRVIDLMNSIPPDEYR